MRGKDVQGSFTRLRWSHYRKNRPSREWEGRLCGSFLNMQASGWGVIIGKTTVTRKDVQLLTRALRDELLWKTTVTRGKDVSGKLFNTGFWYVESLENDRHEREGTSRA
ncbi:hypothetical protein AVEN_103058-1 [Araneus ventricosus]|uniref:Uncharacterized protein n=1 Tax=Araneus ventricosus TaxID=182803 RepID=A0A4Y2B8M6_ARAVE|nr:hypothetical protein AVEN_103058-1 [Araneus ventricosus]